MWSPTAGPARELLLLLITTAHLTPVRALPEPRMSILTGVLVVGTVGHIDHGKTSLVRALTGRDLDRLPEERARGIDCLGFTNLSSSGESLPRRRPRPRALVRTMIAGATGLDAVLFCVSAVKE